MSMYPDYSNNGNNPYDFIMNPATPPKKAPLGGIVPKNNPFLMRILLLVGGTVVLMIAVVIALSFVGKSGINTVPLVGLVQTEAELVRVASEGTNSTVQQSTKNLAINVKFDITTQQQQMINYLSKHGRKVTSAELLLKKSAQTDLQLTNAKAQSTYDQAFAKIMQTSLQSYAASIKQTYSDTTVTSERKLLRTFYSQTELLLSQIPSQASLSVGS